MDIIDSRILFVLVLPFWAAARLKAFRLSRNKGSFSLRREVALNLFFIYIFCLLGVTLFPLRIMFEREHVWVSVNVIPFVGTIQDIVKTTKDPVMHSYMIKFWIKNIAGNLILLLPFGIMVPLLWSKFNSAVKTTFCAFCLSLSIEVLQLASAYVGNVGRAFDVDDILLNTIGAFIGYIIFKNIIERGKNLLNTRAQNS
jgi:glycopeptide antibiotics resistance protein